MAKVTFTIPDSEIPKVIEAYKWAYNRPDAAQQFVIEKIIEGVKQTVRSYEAQKIAKEATAAIKDINIT